MTHTKSYLLLAASVAGAAVLSLACGYWVSTMAQTPGGPDPLEYGIVMAVVMAPIFGGLFWAMTFEPPVVPPAKTVGWRRYRFLMWWAAIALISAGVMSFRWGGVRLEYGLTGLGFGLFLAGFGWAFASQRADRAREIDRFTKRKAVAERASKALMEIAKSDPWLDLPVLNTFLSKPYNAMNWLGDHGYVRPADLSYFAGVADAVVIPETVELEDDTTVPVLVEYVMFVQLLHALTTGEWTPEPVEKVLAHMEQRAAELRKDRLSKKL